MAALQAPAVIRGAGKQGGLAAALLMAALTVGCATTAEFFGKTEGEGPAVGQVACSWQNAVRFVPDPTRNGAPNAGLAGRMYLFDPELTKPVEGDGSVAVFLFDETHGGEPVMLEAWVFDPQTLKRLMKKDPAGPGYTLFLPWEKYRPDISRVRLRVRYQPAKGSPQFTEDAITLAPSNGTVRQGQGDLTLTGGRKAK
jgi:hypothetical protein